VRTVRQATETDQEVLPATNAGDNRATRL